MGLSDHVRTWFQSYLTDGQPGLLGIRDSWYNFHFNKVIKTSFLKSTHIVRSFLAQKDVETLAHTFITSPSDCFISLFTGLPKKSIRKRVQNTVARV